MTGKFKLMFHDGEPWPLICQPDACLLCAYYVPPMGIEKDEEYPLSVLKDTKICWGHRYIGCADNSRL